MLSRINGGSFADRKSVHIIITRVWEKFHIRVFMISACPRTVPEEICGRYAGLYYRRERIVWQRVRGIITKCSA